MKKFTMLVVTHKDRTDTRIVCVTHAGSETHKTYQRLNQLAVEETIKRWKAPFDDYALLHFNYSRDIAEEAMGDFRTFVVLLSGPGNLRDTYREDGIEAARRLLPYQSLFDYYLVRLARERMSLRDEQSLIVFNQIKSALTDEEVYDFIHMGRRPWQFAECEVRD